MKFINPSKSLKIAAISAASIGFSPNFDNEGNLNLTSSAEARGGASSIGGQTDNDGGRGESTNDCCGGGKDVKRNRDDRDPLRVLECGVEVIRASNSETYLAGTSDQYIEPNHDRTLIAVFPRIDGYSGKIVQSPVYDSIDLSPALGDKTEIKVASLAEQFNSDVTLLDCALDQARQFTRDLITIGVELEVRNVGKHAHSKLLRMDR